MRGIPGHRLSGRVTDIDGRRVTAFVTDSAGLPQVLDLRHRSRGRCEQRFKDAKDLGFPAVPHYSYPANRVRMHAVVLAGMLSSWAGLLGADPAELAAAYKIACDARRAGCPAPARRPRPRVRPPVRGGGCGIRGSMRARVLSTAATVARHARPVRVHLDGHAAHASLLAAALARIRGLAIPGVAPVAVFFMLVVLCPYSMKTPWTPATRPWMIRPASRHAWGRIRTVSAVRGPPNGRNHHPMKYPGWDTVASR